MDNQASMQQKFPSGEEYNDLPYAFGFLGHFAGVLAWMGMAAAAGGFSTAPGVEDGRRVVALLQGQHFVHKAVDDQTPLQFVLLLVFAGVLFAIIYAAFWLVLLQMIPKEVVKVSILTFPVLLGLGALACFAVGQMIPGVVFSAFCALMCFFVYMCWDRVAFTSKIMKCTSDTYAKSYSIFGVAAGSVVVQGCWTLCWLLAIYPLMAKKFGNGFIMWPLLLLSYYWSCEVIANILYVSCAGVIARHYYGLQTDEAVSVSTKQACGTSFGSICLGSLIIAVVQTLRTLARWAQDQAEEDENPVMCVLACIAQAILGCIEDIARIFNAYAFSYIALYGQPFWDAGLQVFDMMEASNCEALVSHSLTGMVCLIGSLAGGLFTCLVTAFLAWRAGLTGGYIAGVAFLGFITGVAVMSVISRMMEAGNTTLFICYIEKPLALGDMDGELKEAFDEKRSLS